MLFEFRLRRALNKRLPGKVVYMKDWRKNYTGKWFGPGHLPVALLLHHTAGAATESTDPKAKGNQKGANDGVINYIEHHFRVPASNFTLDRDGTVYVHAANPVWHAGKGSFKNKKPWDLYGIGDNMGNRFMLGVEVVSRGKKKDFTRAQKESLKQLLDACGAAAKWPEPKRLAMVRRPRHKDWTNRKIDILYSHDEIDRWMM